MQNKASLDVKPQGDGSVVTIGIEYSLKYGPIGALMNVGTAVKHSQVC